MNIFDESKEPKAMIFIGHVDCGKSTICGNLLYLSGKVTDTEMKACKEEAVAKDHESWYIAYIMDINEEE